MHQPTESQRTAKDLSPEELEKYSKRLEQHLKNRKVDEALLQRAWQTAHRIAAMLYKDFGAEQVAVFGSLADQISFSEWSDIDIAVWGIQGDTYLDAVWAIRHISTEFKIDLVNFHSTKGRFRERIQSQAVHIQQETMGINQSYVSLQSFLTIREKNDKSYRRKLIERISDEYKKIEQTVEEIKVRLKKIDEASAEDIDDLKALVAIRLPVFYTGLENIFQRVAQEIDKEVPQGKDWHKDLLHQMAAAPPMRPLVISEKTATALEYILKFRHRFRNIYIFELELEGVVENAQRVCDIQVNLSTELNAFLDWLEKRSSDT